MERDCEEVEAVCVLTDVLWVSFIDLAPCTACVVNVSDAAAITIQYAPRALVKVFFIMISRQIVCKRSLPIYLSNYTLIDVGV